jgi:predicted metal-dependent peptidase
MVSQPRSNELTEALSALINQQPFFAVLTFNLLEVVECETFPGTTQENKTAATDSRHLFVNPKFFKNLTVQQRVFVLAHEVTHVILQHPERMKGYMEIGFGPDMKPWQGARFNIAADYVINSYLNELHIGHQPHGTLLNGQYTSTDLVDDVYCKIPEQEDDPNGGGSGQGGQGQGWDQHLPADGSNPPTKAEIQRAVAMAAGAQKAIGSMPAGLQRLVDEIIDPEIPWEDHLERTIVCLYGSEEASWARVNRRRLAVSPHIPWPGRVGNRCGNLALEIDTSGSIGEQELNTFLGCVKGVLQQVMPEKIYAMYVDAALHNDEVIELDDVNDLDTLKAKAGGGGGTDMTVVFREIENRNLDVEAVLVLTDGHTPFGEDVGIPTIWCITTEGIKAPWGDTIHVKLG